MIREYERESSKKGKIGHCEKLEVTIGKKIHKSNLKYFSTRFLYKVSKKGFIFLL